MKFFHLIFQVTEEIKFYVKIIFLSPHIWIINIFDVKVNDEVLCKRNSTYFTGLQIIPCYCLIAPKSNTGIDNRSLPNLSTKNIWGTNKSTANYLFYNMHNAFSVQAKDTFNLCIRKQNPASFPMWSVYYFCDSLNAPQILTENYANIAKNRNSSSENEYIDTLCQKVFVASVTRVLVLHMKGRIKSAINAHILRKTLG